MDARSLYLDLMKRCLLNLIYGDADVHPLHPSPTFDPRRRVHGTDWPAVAHTMIGWHRLSHLQQCVETALTQGVPGDLLEAGVWRGGATILMRAILKAYGITDRLVWVADSFAGVPAPTPDRYPQDAGKRFHEFKALAVSLPQVQENFRRYGLLDDQVRFLPGWFRDTLPTAPVERLAVLRLDGDLYESTMDGLTHLYPRVSPGGFVIVDDYCDLACCRQAVDDYRAAHGITEPITPVDWSAAFWQRGGQAP